MRPFQQAEPTVQMTLVDRGTRTRALDRPRTAAPRGLRRSAVSDVLAAVAFTRLFPFVPIARTDLERNRARTA